MKKILRRKRNLLLLLIPLGILCNEWAKTHVEVAEHVFARGIYKVYSQVVATLTGWIPFSLAELIVAVGPVVILWLLVRQVVRVARLKQEDRAEKAALEVQKVQLQSIREQRFVLLMTAVQNLLCLVAVIFFVYVIGCGVNYHRYPANWYLGLDVQESSVEELSGLLIELAQETSELRAQLTTEDERGVYVLPMSIRELGKEAKFAYDALAEGNPIFGGNYPAPKPVLFSRLMSHTEITGVFTCWTMEANVNVDISPYSIGATMCHELAHLRGFMREDEANYISILACRAADSIDLQYSGNMLALIYVGNALYGKDAELYFEIYRKYYSEGVSRDLRANNEYWDQFEDTKVAEVANKVNDTYLKVNEQEDGVQSYGRVVDLLLAEYRQRKK